VNELRMPWLEACILTPLIGALALTRMEDRYQARRWCVYFSGLTFIFAFTEFIDFVLQGAIHASDAFHLTKRLFGQEWFTIDQFSAPLLPLMALMYFLTSLTTLRTKVRRFSFASTLFAEAITLALYSCEGDVPWLIALLLALGCIPPYLEMKSRGKPTRVFVVHQAAFLIFLLLGCTLITWEGDKQVHSAWAVSPLILAVLIRSGMAPFHCWLTDMFENTTFGTALLFATRAGGAYVAFRLVLPNSPDWVLTWMGIVSLFTAVYAAGMSLVQKDARRFFCYLFLSHSALVLVGMETLHPNGMTGALCVWISVVLSLGGFGLALRAVESRRGRVQLSEYQGLYDHMPTLAVCFLLTGLASVGFPGTIGFIGIELIVDCVVEEYPIVGAAVVIAAALNGIAVVHAYFMIFTGTRHASSMFPLQIGIRERYTMLVLTALIIVGGLCPQPGVNSRYKAAQELLSDHEKRTGHNHAVGKDDHQHDKDVDKKH
jgi:NADH-quinone oxidoreductase subunit M